MANDAPDTYRPHGGPLFIYRCTQLSLINCGDVQLIDCCFNFENSNYTANLVKTSQLDALVYQRLLLSLSEALF